MFPALEWAYGQTGTGSLNREIGIKLSDISGQAISGAWKRNYI